MPTGFNSAEICRSCAEGWEVPDNRLATQEEIAAYETAGSDELILSVDRA
jgi:hypothetical protein